MTIDATEQGMRVRRAQQFGDDAVGTPARPPRLVPSMATAPEDEARLVALQETDERQAAELTELRTWHAGMSRLLQDAVQRLDALETQPRTGVTWADLVARWTSRKWLSAFIPGLVTVIATIGYMLGDFDPRVPAVAAVMTTVLTTVFQVVEGSADKAVRVAQVQAGQVPR